MMRVLHLSGPTVDTRYFATLLPALVSRGVEIHAGTVARSPEPSWAPAAGVSHFALSSRGGLGPWLGRAALQLAARLRHDPVDIVQTHLFEPAIVGLVAGRIARVPVIVTRHHTDEMRLVGTRVHVLADRCVVQRASAVVGFSEAVRRYVVDEDRGRSDKVFVVPQGFAFEALRPDPGAVRRLRTEFRLSDRFVIGDVARFAVTKDQRSLLSAGRLLSQQIPNLSLLLVSPRSLDLDRIVAEEGMADRTVVTGYRTDVPDLLGAMDVVVHPPLTEAFCQVIIEAMAAGRPVVATDVAAAPEVITDGVTGMLVPPRSPRAIAAAVGALHADPGARATLGTAGRRLVEQRFTVENMVAGQLALYTRVAPRAVLDIARA